MATKRMGERLPERLHAVRQDDVPRLHALAAGINRVRDARGRGSVDGLAGVQMVVGSRAFFSRGAWP
ncbi:hypothetical protein [Streptomyces decoyicus]|uniref:hypothetical protein n=1 Tax=Streptomyces decoyicus TaxID=249567 RepID=UPI0033B41B8D